MDEFNNNGGQGYDPTFNNNEGQGYDPTFGSQPATNFNDQPNGATQFGEPTNVYGGQPQYVAQPQYDPNMNGMPQEQNGMSIASMICGILGLVGCWCGCIGLILSIVGIVLGIIGRKKGGKGMALAGIICGAIGILINIIVSILSYGFIMSEM